MWLRDFLPQEKLLRDKARIIIYGYDSALKDGSSISSIREYARNMFDSIHTIRLDEEVRLLFLKFVRW
jgi:hypothetical protein